MSGITGFRVWGAWGSELSRGLRRLHLRYKLAFVWSSLQCSCLGDLSGALKATGFYGFGFGGLGVWGFMAVTGSGGASLQCFND